MELRDATDGDAFAVAAIYEHWVRTSVATFDTTAPTAQVWRERWDGLRAAGWPVLVADDGTRVAGFAYVGPWRPKPAYAHTVESTVYLAPDARGAGLGRLLLSELHPRAASAGARQLIAVVADSDDAASLHLHRSLGFTDVGTLRSVGFKFDRWIDVHLLQKSV